MITEGQDGYKSYDNASQLQCTRGNLVLIEEADRSYFLPREIIIIRGNCQRKRMRA